MILEGRRPARRITCMLVEENEALIQRLLDEVLNVVNKMDVVDEYVVVTKR